MRNKRLSKEMERYDILTTRGGTHKLIKVMASSRVQALEIAIGKVAADEFRQDGSYFEFSNDLGETASVFKCATTDKIARMMNGADGYTVTEGQLALAD